MIRTHANPNARGFSLIEAMVALVIFLVVMGIVLSFFMDFGRSANTQSGALDQQTSARITVDELARAIQMCGYNVDRDPSDDPSTWQKTIIYGGSHAFACNADVDPAIGPIPPAVTVTFPTGDTYVGQGPPTATGGSETYVFTIDANDDGALTLADRSAAVTGSFNPAADTPNPLDFALFRKTYGYNGTDYGGALVPIAGGLFTNATSAVSYPDSTTPAPVFEYWLTEDIDRSQSLANEECVIGTCPPTTTRLPKLYLWGDTDRDGSLSEAERSNVRDKPVGSAAWTGNPFAASGVYKSSTLTAALDPMGSSPYTLTLASVAAFTPGMHIKIDTGADTEYAVVESVVSSTKTLTLNADLHKAHAVGVTVQILPETLLRAVRAVKVQFDSIAPKPDTVNGAQVAGRTGRAGTKGLDYQVRRYEKTIELTNLTTEPLESLNTGSLACPLVTKAVCAGTDVTTLRAYYPSNAPTPLNFYVNDTDGAPVSGITLNYAKTNGTGTLTKTSAGSDSGGLSTSGYTATALGDSTVTASGTCTDKYFNVINFTDTVLVKGTALVATLSNDCLSTVSSRTATPSTGFTVKAQDASGAVPNSPVSLSLQFDPSTLPPTPDYSKVRATLYIGGSAVGSTDSVGAFVPWTGTTGGSGILSGSVVLDQDVLGNGARVNLVAAVPADPCWPQSGNLAQAVTYLKMDLASANPSGCTETSPCAITAGGDAPTVVGTLSLNNVPIQGANVTFTKSDFQTTPGTPPGAAIFQPAAVATTTSTGQASVYVGNNGAASITPSNPLATTVDALLSSVPSCTTPSIVPVGSKAKFIYNGSSSAGKCDADMQQAWIVGNSDKICMHALNPVVANACDLRPTGIKVAVYNALGVLDPQYSIRSIKGGNITTSGTDCTSGTSYNLFTNKCIVPNGVLANNTRYDFKNQGTDCVIPPVPAQPGQFFTLREILLSKDPPANWTIDVTLYYGCDGLCSTSPAKSETWSLKTK